VSSNSKKQLLSSKAGFNLVYCLIVVVAAIVVTFVVKQRFPQLHSAVAIGAFALIVVAHIYLAQHRNRSTYRMTNSLRRILEGDDQAVADTVAACSFGFRGKELADAVAELARLAKLLRYQKLQCELIVSNMTDGVIAVDSDGCITLVNRAAADLLGVKESELVAKKLIETELHPEVIRLGYESITQGKELSAEIQLPGQPPRVLKLRAVYLGQRERCGVSTLIIIEDLTEIRRHERVQKEFLSNVSHELRTPLTAVRTTAEALLSGAKNDTVLLDRFLRTILRETDRLSNLVGDLTEIVRISSGLASTEKSNCEIEDIVFQAVEVVRPLARNKNISISVDVPKNLTVLCDGTQMVHAVRNLVDNAVKYTPEGGSVSVSAGSQDSKLYIRVQDTGIGIPQGEVSRIFERFYRVDKARSREYGGTGLGLSIVKEIVNAHGGEITVETELGKGSTFTIFIPTTTTCNSKSDQAQPGDKRS
jgi:two-component system phosphate regulon sensor histidine kinase PhoR